MIDYETLKTKVSIRDILSRYCEPPHRNHYRVPCVVHQGENCNMVVNESKGLWWCHACSSGGDVITLVAKLENIRNGEAARLLMEERGLSLFANDFVATLRKTARQMEGWKDRQSRPPTFEEEIPETVELSRYRDFGLAAIDHFGLRFIPGGGWGTGVYIPLNSADGTLAGYAIRQPDELLARLTEENGKKPPKYLNSAGLPKGGILYGLWENAQFIQANRSVYLCEGQFDCIRIWDSGIKNVAAVMGSNLSPEQAAILMQYVDRLILVFDGDKAGRDGMAQTKRRYSHLFTIETIALPEGTDPDSADLELLGAQ